MTVKARDFYLKARDIELKSRAFELKARAFDLKSPAFAGQTGGKGLVPEDIKLPAGDFISSANIL